MTPLTKNQQAQIAANLFAACKDIKKLNKTGYDFINQASGFIAHYNLMGFKEEYAYNSLQGDIEGNAENNQYRNFRAGERDAEYYHAKRDCYNLTLSTLKHSPHYA